MRKEIAQEKMRFQEEVCERLTNYIADNKVISKGGRFTTLNRTQLGKDMGLSANSLYRVYSKPMSRMGLNIISNYLKKRNY